MPRTATVGDLSRRLDGDRVVAGPVRLIDLGLFRIGGERYAELDHRYGAFRGGRQPSGFPSARRLRSRNSRSAAFRAPAIAAWYG